MTPINIDDDQRSKRAPAQACLADWCSMVGVFIFFAFAFAPSHILGQGGVIIDELGTADGLSYRWVFDLKKDPHGFLWIATYDGLNRYDGNKFKIFRHDSQNSNSLPGNRVRSIFPDRNGRIWLGIEGTSAGFYHPTTDSFTNFTPDKQDPHSILDQEADRFFEDNDGHVWIGFKAINQKPYTFQKYLGDSVFSSPIELRPEIEQIRNISQDAEGSVWIWTSTQGYVKLSSSGDSMKYFTLDELGTMSHDYLPIQDRSFWYPAIDIENDVFAKVDLPSLENHDEWNNYFIDGKQNIWLHTNQNRVFRSDVTKSTFEFIIQLDFDLMPNGDDVPPQDLTFLVDEENTIWIGHFFGITKVVKPLTLFENYLNGRKTTLGMPINGVSSRAMAETADGKVYLRDQPGNLYYLDQEKKVGKQITPDPKLGFASNSFGGLDLIYDHSGLLWLGLPDGLLSFNQQNEEQIRYTFPDTITTGLISDICRANQEFLWLGRAEGNLTFSLVEKTFAKSPLPDLGLNYCYCDTEQEVIWSSHEKGLVRFNANNHNHQYYPLFDDPRPGGEILSIVAFGDHLWLAGYQGLTKFDPQSGDYVQYSSTDGLPNDIIYSVIASDKELWLGTHAGLTRFNPTTLEMTTFYEEQGLTHNEFNRSSYLKASSGKLFFGGLNGVNAFFPTQLSSVQTHAQTIHLLQLTRYSESRGTVTTLWHALQGIDHLEIKPDEKDVTFDFALTSLADPDYNQYFYMLEGLDDDWKSNGNLGTVRYNKVPPGDYTLRARAKDPHGNWASNEVKIPLYANQVWYQRWWAWCFYAIALAALTFAFYRFKLSRKMKEEERKRLIELDSLKTKLYTNITHEFRTPLTVILGMNESLQKSIDPVQDPGGQLALKLIKRNGNNLLNLINQMLDLSKLDSGSSKLELQQSDLVQYLRYLCEGFTAWGSQKEIDFHFIEMQDEIMMDFDPAKLRQVITNLIGNAIKFTPEEGKIYLIVDRKEPHQVTINIKDTGFGIPPEKLSYIFDRFYQVDSDATRTEEGSGIGLAITKELIALMDGQITVESSMTKGTDFTIRLPIKNQQEVVETLPMAATDLTEDNTDLLLSDYAPQADQNANKPILLIVEDNADVAHFLREALHEQYQLLIAADGVEGTEIALDAIPDIIISDVMMPRRDGFEMCNILKSDPRTSHIPILILTAKVGQEARMKGLEFGADAYLAKPFQGAELLLRLNNFLRLRKNLQERYQNADLISQAPSKEDLFLDRIRAHVHEHFEDEQFGIVHLCRAMNLSRTQLHRKITALTGISTSHLIRRIRVNKAHELLKDGTLSISEIGYKVGFKSPSQFSRAFKEEFGQAPTDIKAGF